MPETPTFDGEPDTNTPPAGDDLTAPTTFVQSPAQEPSRAKSAWYKRAWFIASVTGILGLGIGLAASSTDPKTSPEYKALLAKRVHAEAERDAATQKLEDELGTIPAREEALTSGEAELATAQATLKEDQAAVEEREVAVGAIETEIANNTISDGVYEVGVDIKPGKYKTTGGDSCYWKKSDTPDGDIKANSLIDGPNVVTVSKGEYLEVNCGGADWILQR